MRLIDLHVDWLLQYARETVAFNPGDYPSVPDRSGQLSGYLQSTRAAVFSCYREPEDWARQAYPWKALGQLITRIEAEFPGRILSGPGDFARFQDDPFGLSWGLVGVEGFDYLIRSGDDLGRLAGLFDRGVRVFQLIRGAGNILGGSSEAGDDRGLSGLGREFLEFTGRLNEGVSGPRPLLDLAGMNPPTMADVLTWYESEPGRIERALPLCSQGAPVHPGLDSSRAISLDNLRRLRALGGHVGLGVSPPFFRSSGEIPEAVRVVASLPFQGREGHEGISLATGFLGTDRCLPGLGNAAEIIAWFLGDFDRPLAKALLQTNALRLIAKATGADDSR